MKYLVMKVKRSYAVVLAEDGTFYVVANRNYSVGDYVENPIIMKEYQEEKPNPALPFYRKGLAMGLGIAMAFVLVFGYVGLNNPGISSYVLGNNTDSEVEVFINRFGVVQDIQAKSIKGQKLIEGYDYSDKDKIVVTNELLEKAIELGYYDDQKPITIEVNSELEEYQEIEKDLMDVINKYVEDGYDIDISQYDPDDIEDFIDDLEDDIEDQNEDDEIEEDDD